MCERALFFGFTQAQCFEWHSQTQPDQSQYRQIKNDYKEKKMSLPTRLKVIIHDAFGQDARGDKTGAKMDEQGRRQVLSGEGLIRD